MRNISDKIVEKIKTHHVLNNFFLENRAVYEIMWKNVVQPGWPWMINTAHAHGMLDN
jgi:hypothetical protein